MPKRQELLRSVEKSNINNNISSENISPENVASFPSRLVFWWFNEMILLGHRTLLTTKNLWNLREGLRTENLIDPFETCLKKTLAQRSQMIEPISCNSNPINESNGGSNNQIKSKEKPLKVNIIPILFKIFGSYFLVGSFFKLVLDILVFLIPPLVKYLIAFIEKKSEKPVWHGILLALALFIVSCANTIIINHYFYRMQVTGIKIGSVLTAAVYRKSLELGDKARKEVTTGEIVNLMAVDAKRFVELLTYINMIWSAPFQIIVASCFLYFEMGYSSLFGLFTMILLMPINGIVVRWGQRYQVKFMKAKDERVKFINEILSGIKIIKFFAWENSFSRRVLDLRDKELNHLRKLSYLECTNSFLWLCSPTLVSVTTFAAFILVQGETLTAEKAFVSLSLFHILQFPLSMLPELISLLIMTYVSVRRINKFLSHEELDPYVSRNHEIDFISIEDGEFQWNKRTDSPKKEEKGKTLCFKKIKQEKEKEGTKLVTDKPTLQNINIRVKPGSLVAIVGSVGSGKSSLLSAILGEMEKVKGRINVNGGLKIAYVAQQAWIQSSTLRDNILFGKPYDKSKYDLVLSACALQPDIAFLPGGDLTEIGEKGINLSGGQKQRVSIARACYNDADLYIMDDPLSAVDAHVAKHLFDEVICSKGGLLRNKTRILVTNRLDLLPKVDNIYVLKNGTIIESGTYKEVMESQGDFSELIEQLTNCSGEREEQTEPVKKSTEKSNGNASERTDLECKVKKLIEEETSETGKVAWSVYFEYFGMVTVFWTIFIVLTQAGSNLLALAADVWLAKWSNDASIENMSTASSIRNSEMRLGVYCILGLCKAIVTFLGSWSIVNGTIKASIGFHRNLLEKILRMPMSFFDTNPIGRIINRFSKDIDTIDTSIPQVINYWTLCLFEIVVAFFIISFKIPLFISALVPICAFYVFIQRLYIPSSRQFKRLESVTRSPVYSHFGETLSGVSTIRAFDTKETFIKESAEKVDFNTTCLYLSIIANRWLSVRLEFCGNLIILSTSLFAVFARDTLDPGYVGLIVTYALSLTGSLNWFVRMASEFETDIVAVERISEYCQLPSEADWYKAKTTPEDTWPDKGSITFDKYEARYRPGTDLVLQGISAHIKPKEKIGIVGRTGAGKSTITLSLFRLIEPAGGSIYIDGHNISDLPLHPLRSRLTIIPQDPTLFCGTLRFNLDPFDQYNDADIWNALSHAHLKDFVISTGEGLDYPIIEEGKNLSVGQRQLLCLSRALLKKPKILFLDEATAAIDLETDSLIQKTIRSEFKDCTILTIAHRLNTILDSDRVLVLDEGKVAEFDTPRSLLNDKQSIFYSLAKETNIVS